jgi:Sucrase/ferredoxin-like
MIGTAFPAGQVLLVEQPGPWGRTGLKESHFDAAVAGELETKASTHGIRVLAIRKPGRTPRGAPRRWGYADCRPGRERLVWGGYADDRELLSLDPAAVAAGAIPMVSDAPGQPDHAPSYLVCAHSKHDTCCALRGRPVAAALADQRPGHVWECSHVGGERFAANVLVLPLGMMYGRVLPFAAAEFAAAADEGRVIDALLRGRIGLVPVVQAALAFTHAQLAIFEASALTVQGWRKTAPMEAVVTLGTPHGPVRVTVEIEKALPHNLTCHAAGPAPALSYRPVAIVPVQRPVYVDVNNDADVDYDAEALPPDDPAVEVDVDPEGPA